MGDIVLGQKLQEVPAQAAHSGMFIVYLRRKLISVKFKNSL